MKNFPALLFGLLLLSACQTSQTGPAAVNKAVSDAIEQVYQKLKQAMQAGDAGFVAKECYTADAKLHEGNGNISSGTTALETTFGGMIQGGNVLECHPIEVEVFGAMAYEIGMATMLNKQGNELGKTKYMAVWKNDNGTWKMYRDFVQ